MKNGIENFANKAASDIATKPISRKEAIKKTGYIAVSAATMMLLLNSPAHACTSQANDRDRDRDRGSSGGDRGGR